ncbi:MAG: D-2-hydroxyacid dehydrogenase [Halodesulfurarchaeum sp.]
MATPIEALGVHRSVGAVFPAEILAGSLSDLPFEVRVVGDTDVDAVDAVVTFDYEPAFLEAVDWIHTVQAGYDKFPLSELEDRGITLTCSAGIHGESVGETAVGMMLAFARRLHTYVENKTRGAWERPTWDDPFTLFDETATVVGLGTLGQGIAQRASGMEMNVLGVRRNPIRVPHVRRVYTPDDLHDAIESARFVAIAVPLTEDTEGMFGMEEFEVMRTDAYLINVARGPVVREDELVEAIRDEKIAGAGLDVFEAEPLPKDSPLWDLDEVIISPHVAALGRGFYQGVERLVRENAHLLEKGRNPVNKVV